MVRRAACSMRRDYVVVVVLNAAAVVVKVIVKASRWRHIHHSFIFKLLEALELGIEFGEDIAHGARLF